jgi:hypothetical protein
VAVHTREIAAAEVLDLLDRAAYDLRQGWTAAAYDCLSRALRLLADHLTV